MEATNRTRKPCPHLPEPGAQMSWRDLNRFGRYRGVEFYMTSLRYGHYLWLQGLSARAILALNRGLYADLKGDEPDLEAWPIPYRPIKWFMEHHEGGAFLGNPRVSYQHQAGRMRGARREQRIWRAWACWYLSRQALPELDPDRAHDVREPNFSAIEAGLREHGLSGEAENWLAVATEGPEIVPEM